jgi:hypothetical protein
MISVSDINAPYGAARDTRPHASASLPAALLSLDLLLLIRP